GRQRRFIVRRCAPSPGRVTIGCSSYRIAATAEGARMGWGSSRREFLKQGSLVAALSSGGGLLASAAWAQGHVEARTAAGRVRGLDVGGIKTFKGIPYGASTAGENRFLPPQPVAAWSGVRDALEYGPSAPQRDAGT